MKANLFLSAAAAAALISLAAPAAAQEIVQAVADLEIRTGPGPDYPIVGVLDAHAEATVLGCEEIGTWCEIDAGNVAGWVDSGRLVTAGGDVYINEGPVDGVVSGSIGAFVEPAPPVITYIEENPLDPVYYEGEIVVGAELPDMVEVWEIPDYEYRYVYLNDRPVLVEPDTRRIVYIVR